MATQWNCLKKVSYFSLSSFSTLCWGDAGFFSLSRFTFVSIVILNFPLYVTSRSTQKPFSSRYGLLERLITGISHPRSILLICNSSMKYGICELEI